MNQASRTQGPPGLLHLQLRSFLTFQEEGDPARILLLAPFRMGRKSLWDVSGWGWIWGLKGPGQMREGEVA